MTSYNNHIDQHMLKNNIVINHDHVNMSDVIINALGDEIVFAEVVKYMCLII